MLLVLAGTLTLGCADPAEGGSAASGAGQPATGGLATSTEGGGATTSAATGTAGSTSTGSSTDGTGGATANTGGTNAAGGASANGTGSTGQASCTISVDSYEISSAIQTVGIVTWSSSVAIDSAEIRFGLAGAEPTLSAPVDLNEPNYRTLLLGMKESRDYEFRVVASAAGQSCSSESYSLTTGPAPTSVPVLSRQVVAADAVAPGFIVLSAGIGGFGGMGGPGGMGGMPRQAPPAFIIDQDGDVVWWSPEAAPPQTSRARMDWEGKYLWMMSLNVQGGAGRVDYVSMDGLDGQQNVAGLGDGHHDFTVVPGGGVVAIVHQNGCSAIVERKPDGSVSDIVSDVSSLYEPAADCHPNAISYQPATETFTVSDRNPNLFVKITRTGELIWQFGGTDPKPNALHFPGDWRVNHGHQLLENGNFLFFNNGVGQDSSPVYEYMLNEGTGQATQVWSYSSSNSSGTLGDVQRLPNDNTLITYSNAGVLQEVDRGGNLVQQFSTDSLGYAMHRPTLYGPPPR